MQSPAAAAGEGHGSTVSRIALDEGMVEHMPSVPKRRCSQSSHSEVGNDSTSSDLKSESSTTGSSKRKAYRNDCLAGGTGVAPSQGRKQGHTQPPGLGLKPPASKSAADAGGIDFGAPSLTPQAFLPEFSSAKMEENCSTDVEEQPSDEAILRPFAKLPSGILCKILTNLDAENLNRVERVCRAWQSVAKHAWTNATVRNLDLAKYYRRNCADEVLRKCGPYIKTFVFTPSLIYPWLLKVTFDEELLTLRTRYGLTDVDAVCIRGVSLSSDRYMQVPFDDARSFLGNNFASATELIVTHDLGICCKDLKFALNMTRLTRLCICHGNFSPHFDDVAPGFRALSSTLEYAHFGYTMRTQNVDQFASHIAQLANLKELSIEFSEILSSGCSSCGYGADDPSDEFGLSDAAIFAIAASCTRLQAILIYHPTRVSDAVVPQVIGRLQDFGVFWRGGRFLFPPIHNRGDFDNAVSLLEGTWVRRALDRKGYDVDNECDFEEYSRLFKPLP